MTDPGRSALTGDATVGVGAAVLAAVAFATAALLVRLAGPAPAALVTFGRLAVAALVLAAVARVRGESLAAPPRTVLGLFLVGLVAAAHFGLYTVAVQMGPLAPVLVYVNLSPLWVMAASRRTLGEPPRLHQWLGGLVTAAGIAVVAAGAGQAGGRPGMGSLAAVGAGLFYAAYSVAGRGFRRTVPLLTYAFWVYTGAALAFVPAVVVTGGRGLGSAWPAIVALGLVPTALGHTSYAAALRRLPAGWVNQVATLEVVGGTLLVAAWSHRWPAAVTWPGLAVTMTGVGIAAWDRESGRN